ncbi:AAA family ATPase [Mycolicibacterium sp. XJ870]
MTAVGVARPLDVFTMGLRHLRNGESERAAEAFAQAVQADPMMCDAWLGWMATGERTLEVTGGAYESRRNLGVALRSVSGRNGRMSPDQLGVVTTMTLGAFGLQLPTHTEVHLAIAHAAALAEAVQPQLATAAEVIERQLKKSSLQSGDIMDVDLLEYVRLCLLGLARRWPDVLTFEQQHRWRSLEPDASVSEAEKARRRLFVEYLNLGMLLWKVWALLGTGNAAQAQWWADSGLGRDNLPAEVYQRLQLARGYAMRAQGRRDEAMQAFRELRAVVNDPDVVQAIDEADRQIDVVTAESLATRSDVWDPDSGRSAAQLETDERERRRETIRVEAMTELDKQIGMEAVKTQIRRLESSMMLAQKRAEMGIQTKELALSFIFSGPPGTGKTTMARVLAKLLFGLGIIARPEVEEVRRADLVGEYLGKSEAKTNTVIDRALGGLLFIDEAYALFGKGYSEGDAYGEAAVTTLLARMDNERRATDPAKKLVVVIAGYDADIDRFLTMNEGLPSRFTTRIQFPPYTAEELALIADRMAADNSSLFSSAAHDVLLEHVRKLVALTVPDQDARGEPRMVQAMNMAGNARFIRTVTEKAAEIRDDRLRHMDFQSMTKDQLVTIEAAEVAAAFREASEAQRVPLTG